MSPIHDVCSPNQQQASQQQAKQQAKQPGLPLNSNERSWTKHAQHGGTHSSWPAPSPYTLDEIIELFVTVFVGVPQPPKTVSRNVFLFFQAIKALHSHPHIVRTEHSYMCVQHVLQKVHRHVVRVSPPKAPQMRSCIQPAATDFEKNERAARREPHGVGTKYIYYKN